MNSLRPVKLIVAGILTLAWSVPLWGQAGNPDSKTTVLWPTQNFLGWNKYSPDKKVNLHDLFTMDPVEKYLIIKGTSPGYLVTEKVYSSYELSMEWRWGVNRNGTPEKSEKEPVYQSGVLLHITSEADSIWPKSIQVRLNEGRAGDVALLNGFKLSIHPDFNDPKQKDVYLRRVDGVDQPQGDWNTTVITCHGKFVSVKINDALVMVGRDAEFIRGRIALQSEAGEIHFKNIKLRQLDGRPVDPEKDN